MSKMNAKTIAMVVIPVIVALLSIFVIAKPMTSTDFHAKTIKALDEKQATVMKLTAASTATSVAISAIPSDAGTPIAEKIADLSSYFLIVLCAIFLEKYLVTMTGYATFVILLPLACMLFSANVFLKRDILKKLIAKLLLFGIAIVIVIPLSVTVSNMIEKTYHASIEETISNAEKMTDEMSEDSEEADEDEGFLAGLTSKVKNTVSNAVSKLENAFNSFIEALAVMIVTSCIIPILVLLFFIWLIKVILGADISVPALPKKRKRIKMER